MGKSQFNDQEPSIQYFIKDLVESRESGRSILEKSPIKSSGSNGVVERGLQGVKGQLRVSFLALQGRICRKLDARGRIVNLIPEYAAYLMNRLEVGGDGKVAYDRARCKRPTV